MTRWVQVALLVAIASAVTLAADPQEREIRRAIAEADRGRSALEKGNVKKARESFERSLEAVPGFPQGHVGLGQIAMREKRFDDALTEFRAAETGYERLSSVTTQMEAARYARSRDELQEVRTQLAQLDNRVMKSESSIGGGSSAPVGQLERERALLKSRLQALEAMKPPTADSVQKAPAEILFFEGNALFNLQRVPDAIAAWEAALARDPRLPLVENNLAVAYWKSGRLDDARAAMERAEKLGFKVNPNFRADLERAMAAKK